MSAKVKTAQPQSQAGVIHAQFKQAFNLTLAIYHACNTNDKRLPCYGLVELLYPLAEQLNKLDKICVRTRWSGMADRMSRYSNVLVVVLKNNQKDIPASYLTKLLGPLLADLKLVKLAYTKIASASKAANSKSADANRKAEEGELAEALPTQKPPIRDGHPIATPPENILELIKTSLAGKPDDIWAKDQAYLPTDLTPEEMKIEYDSFMAMFKEYFS